MVEQSSCTDVYGEALEFVALCVLVACTTFTRVRLPSECLYSLQGHFVAVSMTFQ